MRAMLAAIALLVAGCPGGGNGKAEPPKPPPDAAAAPAPDAGAPAAQLTSEQEAMADRAVAMTLDIAGKMQAAGGDCAKLANVVNDWVDVNGAEHQSLAASMGEQPEAVQKALAARMQQKAKESAQSFKGMYQTVEGCAQSNPEFAKAWSRFEQ
jgi:hypothetical protein